MAMPNGMANADYAHPCPGCGTAPVMGELVVLVELPASRAWWHQSCRAKRLTLLRPP